MEEGGLKNAPVPPEGECGRGQRRDNQCHRETERVNAPEVSWPGAGSWLVVSVWTDAPYPDVDLCGLRL